MIERPPEPTPEELEHARKVDAAFKAFQLATDRYHTVSQDVNLESQIASESCKAMADELIKLGVTHLTYDLATGEVSL